MQTKDATKQYRLRQWAQMISECRTSGLCIKDWCDQHGITKANYYYRQKRVREAMLSADGVNEIVPIPQQVCTPANVSANATSLAIHGGLSITVGTAQINIRPDTLPELLAMVLGGDQTC